MFVHNNSNIKLQESSDSLPQNPHLAVASGYLLVSRAKQLFLKFLFLVDIYLFTSSVVLENDIL